MFEISKINRTTFTATASKWLAGAAYTSARDLATAHGGEIATTADNKFIATFSTKKSAKAFVDAWTDAYTSACEARMSEPAKKHGTVFISSTDSDDYATAEPVSAPAPKGKGARKGKGNGKAVDFSKVKGADKHARNRAAHALIVGAGIVSGSEEYNALWKQWQMAR